MSERVTIATSPKLRPYGSRMQFEIGPTSRFAFPAECTIFPDNDYVIGFKYQEADNREGVSTGSVEIMGCTSACKAEELGFRLSQGIMWAAISRNVPIRLKYHTPFPSLVFDRNVSRRRGFSVSAKFSVTSPFKSFISSIREVFSNDDPIDLRLLVCMELFTSARLEATERTRFLGLVSSLEPIATQNKYSGPVDDLIKRCLAELDSCQDFSEPVRSSLVGRIHSLKRESVNFAIRRLINETFPEDNESLEVIRHAYDVRSKLLHEGRADDDLNQVSNNIESVIKKLIASKLKLKLIV